MAVKKDIHKTLRLDQTVVDYIMTFDGNTFSQCFDSMIHLFRDEETDIKKRVAWQREHLDRLQSKINQTENKLNRLDAITYDLFRLDDYVQRIRDDLAKLNDDP